MAVLPVIVYVRLMQLLWFQTKKDSCILKLTFVNASGVKNALKLVFLKRIKQKKFFNLSIILHGRKIENV